MNGLLDTRGPLVDAATKFHFSVFFEGIKKPRAGKLYLDTVPAFVGYVIAGRADQIADKGGGWFFCPLRMSKAYKALESVIAVEALVLDCDGTGTWDRLLAALADLDYCYVAYQTGGWTPSTPKWRIVLPLAAPFDVRDKPKQQEWKRVYDHARWIFGSIAGLAGIGFDGNVACCANAWYAAERRPPDPTSPDPHRRVEAPPRQYIYRLGHALDLGKLAESMPPAPPAVPKPPRPKLENLPSDADRNDLVVRAMSAELEKIPSKKRKLCFALCSALLDHGFGGEDTVGIVEDVWWNQPDDAREAARRIAQYVVDKYESDDWETNGADLAKNWPDVMAAFESAIPDVIEARKQEWFKRNEEFAAVLAQGNANAIASLLGAAPPNPPIRPPDPPTPTREHLIASFTTALAADLPPAPPAPPTPMIGGAISSAQIRAIIRKKRNAESLQSKWDADLIENFMSGERLVAPAELGRFPQLGKFDGEEGLLRVAWVLGCAAPDDVPWDAIVNMRPQGARAPFGRDLILKAGAKFDAAKGRRIAFKKKKEEERQAEKRKFQKQVDAYVSNLKSQTCR